MRKVDLTRWAGSLEGKAWHIKGFADAERVLFYQAPFFGRFYFYMVIAQMTEKG